jgi:hypothetical protein
MAHPSRTQFFPYLKEKLQLSDSNFSIDQQNNLIANSRASWMKHDPLCTHHLVIQDDSIVCDNFREKAVAFITAQEEKRIKENRRAQGYNFFLKQDRHRSPLWVKDGVYTDNVTRGGVAICLPVTHIQPMIAEFDRQRSQHDDDRISEYVKRNGMKILFPVPSLIGHRSEIPSVANNTVSLPTWKLSGEEPVTIPKIIHRAWFGPKPMPLKWMRSWEEFNPDWECRLWTEKDIDKENFINRKHIDYYMSSGVWHGAKDVCQYEILHKYGGVFMDADAECLAPIDELFYNDFDSYSVWENETVRPGLISPLLAAVQGSVFAAELIEGLRQKETVGEPWKTTGNQYMGEMYRQTKANVKIFPSHFMIPEHFTGVKYTGPDKIYARHHFGTTLDIYHKGV